MTDIKELISFCIHKRDGGFYPTAMNKIIQALKSSQGDGWVTEAKRKVYKKSKLVHGVGINDADYPVYSQSDEAREVCPIYKVWKSMLRRCYSEASQAERPNHKGCEVCEEWLRFSNFRAWAVRQPYLGRHLDKDIISPENKLYCPERCMFVPRDINSMFQKDRERKTGLPRGVIEVPYSKYRATYGTGKNQKNLGHFNTVQEARDAYIDAKAADIMKAFHEYANDHKLASALMYRHALLLDEKYIDIEEPKVTLEDGAWYWFQPTADEAPFPLLWEDETWHDSSIKEYYDQDLAPILDSNGQPIKISTPTEEA